MKIFGALALALSLFIVGFGLFVMIHNASNKAIAQRNLARVEAQTRALQALPPGPRTDAQVQHLHDQFLEFGGMNAEANTNLMIGLVSLLGGVGVGFVGVVLLAIGLFMKPPGV
jgi:hypothetical protein